MPWCRKECVSARRHSLAGRRGSARKRARAKMSEQCESLSRQGPFQWPVVAEYLRSPDEFLSDGASIGQIPQNVFNALVRNIGSRFENAREGVDRLSHNIGIFLPRPFHQRAFGDALIVFDQLNPGDIGAEIIFEDSGLGVD